MRRHFLYRTMRCKNTIKYYKCDRRLLKLFKFQWKGPMSRKPAPKNSASKFMARIVSLIYSLKCKLRKKMLH